MDQPTNLVVNVEQPTTKEQLVGYGLGIAFVATSVAVTFAVSALGTWAIEKYYDAKDAKALAKKNAPKQDVTEE